MPSREPKKVVDISFMISLCCVRRRLGIVNVPYETKFYSYNYCFMSAFPYGLLAVKGSSDWTKKVINI